MKESHKFQRRSTRLKGYDYSQPGGYFVTICSKNKEHVLGSIESEKVILSPARKIIEACWLSIPKNFPDTSLGEWIIMPNHLHGIIIIHAPTIPKRNHEKILECYYSEF